MIFDLVNIYYVKNKFLKIFCLSSIKMFHSVGEFKIPSEQIEPSFYETGNFSIFSEKYILLSNGAVEGDNFITFEIPFIRVIDINNGQG